MLYLDLVPTEENYYQGPQKSSLAKKLRDMANIPLGALKMMVEDEGEDPSANGGSGGISAAELAEREELLRVSRASAKKASAACLVDDVLDVIAQRDEELAALDTFREKEEEEMQREKEWLASGIISLEGHLEKKSPAHNLWQVKFCCVLCDECDIFIFSRTLFQNRWFKLSTRTQPEDANCPFIYTLMWFKKEGGAVIKSANVTQIRSIVLMESPRQLAYNKTKKAVMLSSEVRC